VHLQSQQRRMRPRLEGGADPNRPDDLGETPLFEAAASENPDLVAALLAHKADPNKVSFTDVVAQSLATDAVSKTLFDMFQHQDVAPASFLAAMSALNEPLRAKVTEQLDNAAGRTAAAEAKKDERSPQPQASAKEVSMAMEQPAPSKEPRPDPVSVVVERPSPGKETARHGERIRPAACAGHGELGRRGTRQPLHHAGARASERSRGGRGGAQRALGCK